MDLITGDFETYYADGYTLSGKDTTTESYVRDVRFETILCSFKVNAERPFWVPRDDVPAALRDLQLERRAFLAHHAHFDGLILSDHYGVRPRLILDTLGMARALHGANGRLSLAKLAERYGLGVKGDEVINARGLHFADFGAQQLERYGDYSCNDSELAWQLAQRMVPRFSRDELAINDQIVRMFTEPVLELDVDLLHAYAERLRVEKLTLMLQAGVQRADLMSADKFAQALMDLGVEPPRKVSPAWLKKSPDERPATPVMVYAFAKTDPEMQALQEHPNEQVQMLVEARLKNKTTIAEKGAQRLMGMASRGAATVYVKYSGAATHRLSGGDKFNWQSMKRKSDLRNAVMAPAGHVVVVADSSQIEARVTDWLAGQDDMVEVFRRHDAGQGPDPYCVLGEKIYGRVITKEDDPDERHLSKKAKLGLQYGMGWERFGLTVRGEAKTAEGRPLILAPAFSLHVVEVYREAHYQVKKLWRRGEAALAEIAQGTVGVAVDFRGIVRTCTDGLIMPGGLKILFPDLQYDKAASEWTFWNGKSREKIYGPKVIENIVQCLARIIVFGQCLATQREAAELARWVHSMHDEGIFVTHAYYAPWLLGTLMRHMRTPPAWAADLPLNSEGGFHQRYGQAKS
jgi:DNA polymerase